MQELQLEELENINGRNIWQAGLTPYGGYMGSRICAVIGGANDSSLADSLGGIADVIIDGITGYETGKAL